jgi:4-amino-4-deoxy-L-arabinose transferase-like glycosyltransferase
MVVDFQGNRFSKYPLGWPALLSVGVRYDARHFVNPLLAGFTVWLIYRLAKRVFNERVGLLTAVLTAMSPFFLMNTGSLLSHPFGLFLSVAFVISWIDTVYPAQQSQGNTLLGWLPPMTAGLVIGTMVLTRPLTAIGVALPFCVHGIYVLLKGEKLVKRKLLFVIFFALAFVVIHFLWQYILSGDALRNPYTLWWHYDRVGFGPGIGVTSEGHNLQRAFQNAYMSLRSSASDLFGWGRYSWIFLPFGIIAARKNKPALLLSCVFPSLIVTYVFYWIGQWLFGPRYYYEGIYSLTILSAAGIYWLFDLFFDRSNDFHQKSVRIAYVVRRAIGISFVLLLLLFNLFYYLPARLGGMYALYGISREQLIPFETDEAKSLTPALIIVHAQDWTEYGALLELEDAHLTTPFVFVYGSPTQSIDAIEAAFPGREIFHYYPDEPFDFYVNPREKVD